MTKVCYVVCYRDPDYTRTSSLINALGLIRGVELTVVKNRWRGPVRYLEVPLRLTVTRLRRRPDVFVVGFRAHEIFWALYPAMMGKKIIFDEFVDLHDWLVNEHQRLKTGSPAVRLLDAYMRWVMKKSTYVLTDTAAHAKLAVQNYQVPADKLVAVPVGADEKLFYPRPPVKPSGKFHIFFYGTALPLHGIDVILQAAKLVAAKDRNWRFELVGGRGQPDFLRRVRDFIKTNQLEGMVTIEEWVEYEELPKRIAAADLTLGGPFGDTGQARRVVAGKTYQFLAMGRPTVVGEIENMTGFQDKQNCLLVKQGSPEALAEALNWARTHTKQLLTIGRAGRKLFEDRFSAQAISRQLETLVE